MDFLSRPFEEDKGNKDNIGMTLLPAVKFAKIEFPSELEPRRVILARHHDHPTAGHPGIEKTKALVKRRYQGEGLNKFIEAYVRGCAVCQENKIHTGQKKAPLFPINTKPQEGPFQSVSIDLITDLPQSSPHNVILTIVDQGCSKATKFIPCTKEITAEGVATLYLRHLVPWFGTPKCIILDRDPHFILQFAKELCCLMQINQNISTAYYPHTDGQME